MTKFDDVLKEVKKTYNNDKNILKIVLYGSVVRGDYSERHSDLDLFIVMNSINKKLSSKIKKEVEDIGFKYGVKVHPEFQGKETKADDHTLLQKLLVEGKVIVDNYSRLLFDTDAFGLKPYYIYEYNAYNSKKRTLFSKLLHGKKVKYMKKGKAVVTSYPGIDKKKAKVIGRNVLMVSVGFVKEMEQIFDRFDVKYKMKEIVFR